MFVGNLKDIIGVEMQGKDVSGATKKLCISEKEGWKGWALRVIELAPNGYTPEHSHGWQHINYILSGEGVLMMEHEEHKVTADSIAYVPEWTLHQFKNTGNTTLKFICIVPEEGEQ